MTTTQTTDYQPVTSADIKRAVKDGHGRVHLNNVGGKPWISDSFWAAPVTAHFAKFCDTYGIVTSEPASYYIDNAKEAHRSEAEAPSLERVVSSPLEADGYVEVFPYEAPATGTSLVYVRQGDASALVLTSEDGKIVTAANLEYLRVLGGGRDLGETKGYDDNRLTFTVEVRNNREKRRVRILSHKNVYKPMVVAVEHLLVSHHKDQGRQESWVEDFRAVLMAVRIHSGKK